MTQVDTKTGSQSGFNRREFLRGSGAAAAATALSAQGAIAADAPNAAVAKGTTKITLKVNGKSHTVEVEPNSLLLDVLRYKLDLTGAKPVSMDGSSGASTVLVDGKPVTASTTLVMQVKDKTIQTVESLGGEKPDAVPLAFVAHDAEQCGFCTPGFVMAVRAFLNKNPKASEEEIRGGLNGNICRCGTYANIIQAAVAVVKGGA